MLVITHFLSWLSAALLVFSVAWPNSIAFFFCLCFHGSFVREQRTLPQLPAYTRLTQKKTMWYTIVPIYPKACGNNPLSLPFQSFCWSKGQLSWWDADQMFHYIKQLCSQLTCSVLSIGLPERIRLTLSSLTVKPGIAGVRWDDTSWCVLTFTIIHPVFIHIISGIV